MEFANSVKQGLPLSQIVLRIGRGYCFEVTVTIEYFGIETRTTPLADS